MQRKNRLMMSCAMVPFVIVAGAAVSGVPISGMLAPTFAYAACNPCNPCAAACNPCNPCAAACNPCNPCAAAN